MPFITQGKTNLKYILIVVILAVIVGGGILGYYYSWIKELDTRLAQIELRLSEVKSLEDEAADLSSKASATEDWKTYRNEELGFEVRYPGYAAIDTENLEYDDVAQILLDKEVASSPCYEAFIERISISTIDLTSLECLKEGVFLPTPNEEVLREVSKELSEEGWPERKEINNSIFYRNYSDEHAMGGQATQYYTYQTFYNDICYGIALEVDSSHSFGFTDECPLSLSESPQYEHIFEEENRKLQELFFSILSTFRFLE